VAIRLRTPGVDELDDVADVLRSWQRDDAPMQLHPGDIGWFRRFGEARTAAALRIWTRGQRILAMGLLDGDDLLRLTMAPDVYADRELAGQVAADTGVDGRGVFAAGPASIEAPTGVLLRDVLTEAGWSTGEAWTPLSLDLDLAPEIGALRIEVIGTDRAAVRVAIQRAAFAKSTMTVPNWHAMAAGAPYADARCLVAYSEQGDPVGAITVWSAGRGRPGLIEPLGVDPAHRAQGFGTAITVAGAAVLRSLGSSSATVCTASSNVAAVATYKAAGFAPGRERLDLTRG
jgi:ribosomal protein S18 acetylase RimI-like enzyme